MNALPPDAAANSDADSDKVRKVELVISTLLRAGVVLSFVIVLAGMLLSFVHHPDYLHSATQLENLTRTGANFPRSVAEVWSGVRELKGQAFVIVGLMILIATPVLRVAVSIFAFIYQRDRTYVIITSIVLVLLLASFVLGRVEG
jgi:uncharacterized membrane protein